MPIIRKERNEINIPSLFEPVIACTQCTTEITPRLIERCGAIVAYKNSARYTIWDSSESHRGCGEAYCVKHTNLYTLHVVSGTYSYRYIWLCNTCKSIIN